MTKYGPRRDHAKRALAREAVNRVAARRLVHRQPVLAALERETGVGDTARPWEKNRDAAAMRMRAPIVGVRRTRNHFDRARAIAQALASRLRHDHGALALRFKRDQFHGDTALQESFGREVPDRKTPVPSSELTTFCCALNSRTTIAHYPEMPELTSGRVRRRDVLHHRHRRRRPRHYAPAPRSRGSDGP